MPRTATPSETPSRPVAVAVNRFPANRHEQWRHQQQALGWALHPRHACHLSCAAPPERHHDLMVTWEELPECVRSWVMQMLVGAETWTQQDRDEACAAARAEGEESAQRRLNAEVAQDALRVRDTARADIDQAYRRGLADGAREERAARRRRDPPSPRNVCRLCGTSTAARGSAICAPSRSGQGPLCARCGAQPTLCLDCEQYLRRDQLRDGRCWPCEDRRYEQELARLRARFPTLSTRTVMVLHWSVTAEDLPRMTDAALLALRNLGRGSLAEIRRAVPAPEDAADGP